MLSIKVFSVLQYQVITNFYLDFLNVFHALSLVRKNKGDFFKRKKTNYLSDEKVNLFREERTCECVLCALVPPTVAWVPVLPSQRLWTWSHGVEPAPLLWALHCAYCVPSPALSSVDTLTSWGKSCCPSCTGNGHREEGKAAKLTQTIGKPALKLRIHASAHAVQGCAELRLW